MNLIPTNTFQIPPITQPVTGSFSGILRRYGLIYERAGHYLQVGQIGWVQGWILDISVIRIQIPQLLDAVLPYFISEQIPFKLAGNSDTAQDILNGKLGYLLLGKILSLYPPTPAKAREVAGVLIELTSGFRGPRILTDHHLGGAVYTRYGAGNPVIMTEESGAAVGGIYNPDGVLVKERWSIPFALPPCVEWPFSVQAPLTPSKPPSLLNDKYKVLSILKPDAKGNVLKAIFLQKWYIPKWCVIKAGNKDMNTDLEGRDVRDRLRWQHELHQDLAGCAPLPGIYDLFEQEGVLYLVMQYIRGRNLDEFTVRAFRGKPWSYLPLATRLTLLDYTAQVLRMIGQLHQKGYLHRDIMPANFLVARGKVRMIDLELAYSIHSGIPAPPFGLGTAGFMSPEQEAMQPPTLEQDIYAVGALLMATLTGLLPDRFATTSRHILEKQLRFFIPNERLANTIISCFAKNPQTRPGLDELTEALNEFRQAQGINRQPGKVEEPSITPAPSEVQVRIEKALAGLATPALTDRDNCWFSKTIQEATWAYYQMNANTVYPGFQSGVSGVLYLLAQARKAGFSVEPCWKEYQHNLSFLRSWIAANLRSKTGEEGQIYPGGFYAGTAGMALALAEGIRSGLIPEDSATLTDLNTLLSNDHITGNGITKGIAGRGMALLGMRDLLDPSIISSVLHGLACSLLEHQQRDGSWLGETIGSSKPAKATGFGHGVAGVSCFLFSYHYYYRDERVLLGAEAGLNWLLRQGRRRGRQWTWRTSTKGAQVESSLTNGIAGIALTLIKAYQVTGKLRYRKTAEEILQAIPHPILRRDLTQENGLAGIGELYLEAYKVFGALQWMHRADWITTMLLHLYREEKSGACYWMPDTTPFATAGLMNGNSGIIHFLLRYQRSSVLTHPMLPF